MSVFFSVLLFLKDVNAMMKVQIYPDVAQGDSVPVVASVFFTTSGRFSSS